MRTSVLTGLLCLLLATVLPSHADDSRQDALQRGAYIFHLGGCASCHTVKGGEPLAGGLKMETKFGDFYTPNISPDRQTGIGGWSEEDFVRAMKKGLSPDGEHYYPAFPYTSYARMTRQDLLDLKYYLDTQPAVVQPDKAHDLKFPYNFRSLIGAWKLVNFDGSGFQYDNSKSKSWNRGAYIVNGPGHCVECHTPRNFLGGLQDNLRLTGNPNGPEGEKVPGITNEAENQISEWSREDIFFALQIGMIPDGDFLGGSMGHVIDNTTGKLTDQDLNAIINYLADP